MTTPEAGFWQYGVAHMEEGEVVHAETCLTVHEAHKTAVECAEHNGTPCAVVRRYVPTDWQPLPAEATQ